MFFISKVQLKNILYSFEESKKIKMRSNVTIYRKQWTSCLKAGSWAYDILW